MTRCAPCSAAATDTPASLVELAPTRRLMQRKARQLVRRREFRRDDLADVFCEIRAGTFQRLAAFRPKESHPATYTVRAISSVVADMVRARACDSRRTFVEADALDAVRSPHGRTSHEPTEADRCRSRGGAHTCPLDAIETAEAIAAVLAGLPPGLRDLCRRLREVPACIAQRELGISRRELARRIEAIRESFLRAGFGSATLARRPPKSARTSHDGGGSA